MVLRGNGTSVSLGGLFLIIDGGSISSWSNGEISSLGLIWSGATDLMTAPVGMTFIVDGGSALACNGGGHMFVATAFFILVLQEGSILYGANFPMGTPNEVIDCGSSATAVIVLYGSGTNVDNDIATGTSGSKINYVFGDAQPELNALTTTDANFSGTKSFDLYAKAENVKYNPSVSGLTATTVDDAIDELASEKVDKAGDTMTGPLLLPAGTTSAPSLQLGGTIAGIAYESGALLFVNSSGATTFRAGPNLVYFAMDIQSYVNGNGFNIVAGSGIGSRLYGTRKTSWTHVGYGFHATELYAPAVYSQDSGGTKQMNMWWGQDKATNVSGDLRIQTKTPSTASDTGTTGTIAYDADYIYICVATDTWKRTSIATW